MKNLLLAVIGYLIITATIALFLACNDDNVKQIQATATKKIFAVDVGNGDTVYLREVFVDCSTIFFVCDQQGKPITGTSAHSGKTYTATVMPDTIRDTMRDTIKNISVK